MVCLITALLAQEAEEDRLLSPERDILTTYEKGMLLLQHRGSRINGYEQMACAANSEARG
jgi:hypothetical protein